MAGILDSINDLISRGVLSDETIRLLTGQQPLQPQQKGALDTGDDTQRMLNRQRALEQGGGSVTNPAATLPAGSTPPRTDVPMIVQALQNGGVPAPIPGGEFGYSNDYTGAPIVNAAGTSQTPGEFGNPSAAFTQSNAPQQGNWADKLGLSFDRPLARLAMGLGAAGSPDPMGTLLKMKAAEEDQRVSEQARTKPKFVPVAGTGGGFMVYPDGRKPQFIQDAEAAKFLSEQSDNKRIFEFLKIKAKAEEDAKLAGVKVGEKQNLEDKPALEAALSDTKVLRAVADGLRKNPDATGPVFGLLPQWARDVIDPKASSFQQQAESVALKSLRAIFGAQFTENEGKQFLARYYNTRLPGGMNADRLEQMADDIESLARNKEAASSYLAKNGTLKGFEIPSSKQPNQDTKGSDLSSQAQSAFGSYDPDQYEYRMNNGVLQRRKK